MTGNCNVEYQPDRRMKMRKTILRRHDSRNLGPTKVSADVLDVLHKHAIAALEAGSEPIFNHESSNVGNISEAT